MGDHSTDDTPHTSSVNPRKVGSIRTTSEQSVGACNMDVELVVSLLLLSAGCWIGVCLLYTSPYLYLPAETNVKPSLL